MAAPDTSTTVCQGTPDSTASPTMSGADSAPRLKNRWSRFIARPRPSRYRSRTRPFAPPSRQPAPRPPSRAAPRNHGKVGARPRLAIPSAVHEGGAAEDGRAAEPLGRRPAAERAGGVRQRVGEVDHPDAGVVDLERELDRADERGDEQPGPADGQQGQAADDGGRQPPAGEGVGHPGMLPVTGGAGRPPGRAGSRGSGSRAPGRRRRPARAGSRRSSAGRRPG